MTAYQVLLVHSPGASPVTIQKLLEERQFLIHVSRTWEETERTYARIPKDQLKYIFLDLTLCNGSNWEQFMRQVHGGSGDTILVHFHPRFPHNLANLLNLQTAEEGEPAGSSDQQTPLIIGDSAKFREVIGLVHRYAPYDITVLITGETGTGKEVMARYIHEHSARRDGPLVACNMTAIPETLVESELFGYVKGAFTGAERNKKGLIETAEGGSLFLDEIGDLPLAIQLKLLRFLESREFYRVGESTPKTANVRIIAATNKQMERAIQEQRFREDLYYRLNSARVILPSLRERREDIPYLVRYFVDQFCAREKMRPPAISREASALLLDHDYPGNVRELQNLVEGAVSLASGSIDAELIRSLRSSSSGAPAGPEALDLAAVERRHIQRVLQLAKGNKSSAARLLGVDRRTLARKGF